MSTSDDRYFDPNSWESLDISAYEASLFEIAGSPDPRPTNEESDNTEVSYQAVIDSWRGNGATATQSDIIQEISRMVDGGLDPVPKVSDGVLPARLEFQTYPMCYSRNYQFTQFNEYKLSLTWLPVSRKFEVLVNSVGQSRAHTFSRTTSANLHIAHASSATYLRAYTLTDAPVSSALVSGRLHQAMSLVWLAIHGQRLRDREYMGGPTFVKLPSRVESIPNRDRFLNNCRSWLEGETHGTGRNPMSEEDFSSTYWDLLRAKLYGYSLSSVGNRLCFYSTFLAGRAVPGNLHGNLRLMYNFRLTAPAGNDNPKFRAQIGGVQYSRLHPLCVNPIAPGVDGTDDYCKKDLEVYEAIESGKFGKAIHLVAKTMCGLRTFPGLSEHLQVWNSPDFAVQPTTVWEERQPDYEKFWTDMDDTELNDAAASTSNRAQAAPVNEQPSTPITPADTPTNQNDPVDTDTQSVNQDVPSSQANEVPVDHSASEATEPEEQSDSNSILMSGIEAWYAGYLVRNFLARPDNVTTLFLFEQVKLLFVEYPTSGFDSNGPWAVVSPSPIRGIDFGKFRVNMVNSGPKPTVEALDPNLIEAGNPHPHVYSDGKTICLGDHGVTAYKQSVMDGRFTDACDIVCAVLSELGPNPYQFISHWYGSPGDSLFNNSVSQWTDNDSQVVELGTDEQQFSLAGNWVDLEPLAESWKEYTRINRRATIRDNLYLARNNPVSVNDLGFTLQRLNDSISGPLKYRLSDNSIRIVGDVGPVGEHYPYKNIGKVQITFSLDDLRANPNASQFHIDTLETLRHPHVDAISGRLHVNPVAYNTISMFLESGLLGEAVALLYITLGLYDSNHALYPIDSCYSRPYTRYSGYIYNQRGFGKIAKRISPRLRQVENKRNWRHGLNRICTAFHGSPDTVNVNSDKNLISYYIPFAAHKNTTHCLLGLQFVFPKKIKDGLYWRFLYSKYDDVGSLLSDIKVLTLPPDVARQCSIYLHNIEFGKMFKLAEPYLRRKLKLDLCSDPVPAV